MAALSCYSNWEAPFEPHNSDFSTFFTPPPPDQLPPQLLASCINNDFDYYFDDNYFDPNEVFCFDENCNALSASFNPQNQLLAPTFPTQQPIPFNQRFNPYHCPETKRKRPEEFDYEDLMFADALFNDPAPTPCLSFQQFCPPETVAPPALPDFATAPPVFNVGHDESNVKKEKTSNGNLSAQSIAARQRRRKITEKTQELSKLIPGAHRMNTAEMFGAAYKYIKCLQAQVGILELMGSYDQDQEKGKAFESEELHCLVESTLVQEKLYSTAKCLVPTKFVQELSSNDQMLKEKPHVMKEIKELVPIGES